MNALVRDPSAAAERMRLHRERRRQGLRCLMIEIRESEVDILIGKGLLDGEMRNDPDAVCDALYKSRSRKSAQGDKWSFCLTAGTLWPANQERP